MNESITYIQRYSPLQAKYVETKYDWKFIHTYINNMHLWIFTWYPVGIHMYIHAHKYIWLNIYIYHHTNDEFEAKRNVFQSTSIQLSVKQANWLLRRLGKCSKLGQLVLFDGPVVIKTSFTKELATVLCGKSMYNGEMFFFVLFVQGFL